MNVQEVKDALDQWIGHNIVLTKQEDGDIDTTMIALEKSSFVKRGKTIDGYVSPVALQLRGKGTVPSSQEGTAPLPDDRYDIPLTDDFRIHRDDDTLCIETERAKYTVTRK